MLTLQGLEAWYTQTVKMKHAFAGTTPPDPIPLPDVTNVDGLLEGIAQETEETLVSAAKYAGAFHGDDVAYKLTLPDKIYRWYGIKKVGGKTLLLNQAVDDSKFVLPSYATMDNHKITFNGSATGTLTFYFLSNHSIKANNKYIVATAGRRVGNVGRIRVYDTTHSKNIVFEESGDVGYQMFTVDADCSINYYFQAISGNVFDMDVTPQLFNLTEMYGAGNEPAMVEEFQQMFPVYCEYNAGELKDTKVTSVVSKDGSGNTLQTISIPSGVQALTGYGYSTPNQYNYIDFENKKFVQIVGRRAYTSGDESDPTVITDGTNTNYKLSAPVETSITLPDTDIEHEAGGSITFENTNKIPLPVIVEYIGV